MMASAKQLRSRSYRMSCHGKVRYSTLEAAEQAAGEVNRRIVLRFPDGDIQAYKCAFSRHFHTGHWFDWR